MIDTIYTLPTERERIMKDFDGLSDDERKKFDASWKHLRHLWILWQLDEPDPSCPLSGEEKRHALLAYKALEMVWFEKLPNADKQPFAIYIRDRVPHSAIPEIDQTFGMSIEQLASYCKDLPRPDWVRKNATAVKISIKSFPHRST